MTPITIPRQLVKNDDLVLIPRKEYEQLLRGAGKSKMTKLDRDLNQTIKEYRAGKVVGPFKTTDALMHSLRSR